MEVTTLMQQIEKRRSIRKFDDKPISEENQKKLIDFCKEISTENFTFLPVFNEPTCFASKILTFGMFKNVKNYIVVKCKMPILNEKLIDIGYCGANLLLFITSLSLGSTWCAATFSKGKCHADLKGNEELISAIALGVPTEQKPNVRNSKSLNEVSSYMGEAPTWFINGVKAALRAPTAMNRQEFKIRGSEEGVEFQTTKERKSSLISFGIAKRFFELGAYPTTIKYI